MMQQLRSPLKRIGGKSVSASRIVSAFPDPSYYDVFVDVMGGASHILLAKPAYHHEEIYNDLEGNLVAFWLEVQRDASALQAYLNTLPYSRELYYTFYRSLFDDTPLTQFERAVRYFYTLRSTGTGWLRKSPVGWDHRVSNVHSFYSALEVFQAVQERFRYVAIDNRDVLATIERYALSTKKPQRVLMYLDPPYFGAEGYYEASKKGFPHEEMAALLQKVKGYVAVSYYPHPSIDVWYPPEKWRRMAWQQAKNSQIQIERREEDIATEMLLLNYPEAYGLWESA